MDDIREQIKKYKNNFRNTISIPGIIKFGLEVEFSCTEPVKLDKSFILNKNYKLERDYSGPCIYEAISPVLNNNIETWENLKDILKNIKNNDGMIVGNEGGHIHYDISILDKSNINNFLKLWYTFEDVIYQFSNGDYVNLRNSAFVYAKKLDKNLKEMLDNNKKSYYLFNKEYGLNLTNIYGNNDIDTYEVRTPNASLNAETWQNNVEFFANLFMYANGDNNDVIDKLYNCGRLESNLENAMLLSEIIYKDEEAKKRFLRQFIHVERNFILPQKKWEL